MTINERLEFLENELKEAKYIIGQLLSESGKKFQKPVSIVGGAQSRGNISPVDSKTGLNPMTGGAVIWHTSELGNPPNNEEPMNPESIVGAVGYNKHSHSKFSGGALIKDVLEIVEYDWDNTDPEIENMHSQSFWVTQPKIKQDKNTNNENVDKIGLLDLVFNPDTQTWGCAALEIDIKKCYLVERDSEGNIALDSKGQQKKSLLYNSDSNKTSIIWDENGNCFRFLAVYATGE
jgi:hypothetical protein